MGKKKATGSRCGFQGFLCLTHNRANYMSISTQTQREKTDTLLLTVLPTPFKLRGVVIEFTASNIKLTCGGKVHIQRPPQSGFCISTAQHGKLSVLSGVATTTIPPHSGNTRGVSVRTLDDSRQFLNCRHINHTYEVNAL